MDRHRLRPGRRPTPRLGRGAGRALLGLALLLAPAGAQETLDWKELYREALGLLRDSDPQRNELGTADMLALWEDLRPVASDVPNRDWFFANASVALWHARALPEEVARSDFYLEAVNSAARAGLRELALVLANSGCAEVYEAGDVAAATSMLEDALATPGEPARLGSVVRAKISLAIYYRRLGRWEEGLELLDDAEQRLTAAEEPEHDDLLADLWGERAQSLIDQGAIERADACLREEERFARAAGYPECLAGQARHEIAFRLATADYEGALELARECAADATFREVRDQFGAAFPWAAGVALSELARLDPPRLQREKLEAARKQLEAARSGQLGEFEAARVDLYLADIALRQEDLPGARKEVERARSRLEGHGEEAPGVDYKGLASALEARCLRRAGASRAELAAQDSRFEITFEEFLERWRRTRNDADLAFLDSDARRTLLSERMLLTLDLHPDDSGRAAAFEELLRAQALGSLAREAGMRAPGLDQVRSELLPEGSGMLVYFPSPEDTHVFALDRDTILHGNLGPELAIGQGCRRLNQELLRAADPGSEGDGSIASALRNAAAQVTNLLLPAEVARLVDSWSAVTVVGSEFFYDVPFEYLRDGDGNPLGTTKAVDSVPTVPLGLVLARKPRPSSPDDGPDIAILGARSPGKAARERYGKKLVDLPLAGRDLARLTHPFEEGRVLTELDLTPAQLCRLPLEGVPVVHFFVHGVYELGYPGGAALVLQEDGESDGLLRIDDVEHDLKVSGLVILSACGGARGSARWGNDHRANQGGAFLAAGARCVVYARGPIFFEETLDVMEVFHRELRAGASPAEALRRARAELGGPKASERLRAQLAQLQVLGLGQEPVF